ncbi:MAG TPA: glycerate kinase [Desulfuromonadaceae bacterium]
MSHESTQMIRAFFDEALRAVDPYRAVSRHCGRVRSLFENEGLQRLCFVSLGKAAALMARALLDGIGEIPLQGIVVTKYGHVGACSFPDAVTVFESGHPIPDENGVRAAGAVLELLGHADGRTLAVFLISGGGSSLLSRPCPGISLAEKRIVTELLLKAGADIYELNTVRKHLSAVKGGRLAEAAAPARIISLVLSDVIGDPLDVIASGPVSPDTSTFGDAVEIVAKYGLAGSMPQNVIELLSRGAGGLIPETPKPGAALFERVESIVVGNNAAALEGARRAAERAGYAASIVATGLTGEASRVGQELAKLALERLGSMRGGEKVCLVAGGETTVTVTGNGAGGRNTELALAFGIAVRDVAGITLLSAGTDGTDGPTDAAGAIVTGRTMAEALRLGLDPRSFLVRNDSYTFFKAVGGLVMTGPTGTNVMDVQVILLEK